MWQKATKLPGKASLAKLVFLIKNDNNRTSLVIQWLRHHTSTSGGMGSIPGPTCQAIQLKSKKKKKDNNKERTKKQTKLAGTFHSSPLFSFFLQDPHEMPRSGATILPLLGPETQALVVQAEAWRSLISSFPQAGVPSGFLPFQHLVWEK